MAIYTENYVSIEIWSDQLNKIEEKDYIHHTVMPRIKSVFPQTQVFWIKKSSDVEARNCPEIHMAGYEIALSNIDPTTLKNLCMELEINSVGKRISDIDVYHRGGKNKQKNHSAKLKCRRSCLLF